MSEPTVSALSSSFSFDSLESRLCLSTVQLSVAGTYAPPAGTGSAEIVAYDPQTARLFVVSAVQQSVAILDASDPENPTLVDTIDVSPLGGPNSVAVRNGVVAVALENNDGAHLPGKVAFYDTDGDFLNAVTVGALPDMLTFAPDGSKLLVANEGEPEGYLEGQLDPEGSISLISFKKGVSAAQVGKLTQKDVDTADFKKFNSRIDKLRAAGVRIFGPGATVAQDLEPEYITVSADSRTAWVTLQENNAIAIVNVKSGEVKDIVPLGYKDHSLPGNELDAGERDGAINIVNRPLLGMYQPDAVASYQVGGQTYLVTANEGDAREYDGLVEATRITNPNQLDAAAFPDRATLVTNANIARLNVTNTLGRDGDGDAQFETLYAFGGRSISIRDAAGNLIFDSGDALEQITAEAYPEFFNASNDNNTFDNRSDDKGPEPEGVVVGVVDGKPYAFVGLERIGGVVVFDVSDPTNAVFVDYLNNRDFTVPATIEDPNDPEEEIANPAAGDLGPEGLTFVSAADSPTGRPLLVVANEISGTVTIFNIDSVPDVPTATATTVAAPKPTKFNAKKSIGDDDAVYAGVKGIFA